MISLCGFSLNFPNNYVKHVFMYLSAICMYILFSEMSALVFCLSFNWTICLFLLLISLYILDSSHLLGMWLENVSYYYGN